jgi:hypothetical protein
MEIEGWLGKFMSAPVNAAIARDTLVEAGVVVWIGTSARELSLSAPAPKMYECPGHWNPVALYELYASKRPTGMRDPSDPFYIATRTIPLTGTEGEQWFVRFQLLYQIFTYAVVC